VGVVRIGLKAIGMVVAAGLLVGAAGARPSWMTISAHSPYDGCPSAGQDGLFADAEVEPSLAVNPRDPRRLISAYQQDRFSNGAARGLVASYSEDGGATWSEATLPFSVCAGAATTGWPRASDPWVSIDGGGQIYVAGIGRGIAVSTSTNGGRRWSAPASLAANSATYLMDKVAVTADPQVPSVAYVAWERYLTRANGPPIESDTLLSVTRDRGRHWSRPSVVLAHSKDAGAVASVILVDSRRRQLFHLAYWQRGGFPGPGLGHLSLLLVQRSSNGGRSWTKPRRIARITTVGGQLRDPASGKIIRPGVPSFAIDAASGALYVAWQEARFSNGHVDQVAITRSGDRGQTWSKPRRVDVGSANLGIVPVVAADRGVAAVSYYSVAPAGNGGNAQLTLAVSNDGAKSFKRQLVGPAFTFADAPLLAGDPSILVPPGLFVGDYSGLAVQAGRVYMAFATANHDPANQTDIRFAELPAS
jgi:hypothetical protein